MVRSFHNMIRRQWDAGRFVCVGLDIEYDRIPKHIRHSTSSVKEAYCIFGKEIIAATHDLVCAYKLQIAHYEAAGKSEGIEALYELVDYIKIAYPTVPIILDAKCGDVQSTNEQYAHAIFDLLGADAVTLQPYLGSEPLEPFLKRKEKGCIVLCRTSNPGAGEIQDLLVDGMPLWQKIALLANNEWNKNLNCLLVVGATYPEEMGIVRFLVSDIPFLIPGAGTQGGNLEASVRAGMDSNKQGMIINSSRGILYASSEKDFAQSARMATEELHNAINNARGLK